MFFREEKRFCSKRISPVKSTIKVRCDGGVFLDGFVIFDLMCFDIQKPGRCVRFSSTSCVSVFFFSFDGQSAFSCSFRWHFQVGGAVCAHSLTFRLNGCDCWPLRPASSSPRLCLLTESCLSGLQSTRCTMMKQQRSSSLPHRHRCRWIERISTRTDLFLMTWTSPKPVALSSRALESGANLWTKTLDKSA